MAKHRKRNQKRISSKKRKARSKMSGLTNRSPGILLPQKTRMKLPFRDGVVINTSAGTNFYEAVYSGNDIRVPMSSGGTNTTKAMLFDNLIALYRRFRVVGSKVTVNVMSASAVASSGQAKAILIASRTAIPITTTYVDQPNTWAEQDNSNYTLVGTIQSSAPRKLYKYRSTKYMLQDLYDDQSATGVVDASPTSQWYWHLVFHDLPFDAASGTLALYIDVRVVYYVDFQIPTLTPGS